MSKLDWEKANRLEKARKQGQDLETGEEKIETKVIPSKNVADKKGLKLMLSKLKLAKAKEWLIQKNSNPSQKTQKPKKITRNGKAKGVMF